MIVRFKQATEEVLNSVLNKIPAEDYALISGVKIVITDNDYAKAEKSGFYNYNGINVDFNLIEQNPTEDSVNFGQDFVELYDYVNENFIHCREVVEALYTGLVLEENVLFFGRGGHGKSEMTEAFYEKAHQMGLIKNKPFVLAVGEGLTEEALFGGLNMKKFTDIGEYEYLVLNSFMNHEDVIIEEIFDAPASILLSLKDIITSGYFRKGHQVFKIKTKRIIGLTNKSKETFSEDDSLEALVQRFPITRKVEWESYTKKDFRNLFNKVFRPEKKGDFLVKYKAKLADICEIFELNNSIGSSFVSPRTAVKAAKIYAFGGSLDLISDIDKDVSTKYFKENKDTALIEEYTNLIEKANTYFENIKSHCSKFLHEELEDSVLSMLQGDKAQYSDRAPLTEDEKRFLKICMNKLAWAENHVQINHAPNVMEDRKKEVTKNVADLKNKIVDLLK